MHISEFEPLRPSLESARLADLALAVEREAASVGHRLHPDVAQELVELLRGVNSYYSNKIEGNDTTPAAVAAAMRREYATDSTERALQREALAHIEVEMLSERWLRDDPTLNPIAGALLRALHREFYERVDPTHRWVENASAGLREAVIPGALRHFEVTVGHHRPPPAESLVPFLDRAATVYDPTRLHGLTKVLAFAASHHRLLWVHPFGDGNGRVVRLASLLMARRIGLGGMGLWTPSRGLARQRGHYLGALAAAALPRRNDHDGRGALSLEGLDRFTEFFLGICLAQIRYMGSVLDLEGFAARIDDYVARRANGALSGPTGRLSVRSTRVLRHCLHEGRTARGRVASLINGSPRLASAIIAQLLAEGLLRSDSPKGDVRLGIPLHALRYLLPELYPEGVV